jgi:gas vesicle protein
MESFNYHNYHSEVEQFFVSKRGAPMFISPLDWSLVESWKNMGIPLHVVLRGITSCFDSSSKTNGGKRVNTLFYCQQEVLSNFKNYVESQIGGHRPQVNQVDKNEPSNSTSSTNNSGFSKKQVIIYITECSEELEQARLYAIQQKSQNLAETLSRVVSRLKDIIKKLENNNAIDSENLERDLTLLEELIYQSLRNAVSQEDLLKLEAEANQQLYPHKRAMEPAIYQQTLQNYIAKKLRERHFIPRLSLFYMI